MENQQIRLGKGLRELRQSRQWSLDHAAAKTGVSKAMLGQIERGESSPTLATLWKIATGFQVSFTQLVSGWVSPENDVYTQLNRAESNKAKGIEVRVHFPYDPQVGFEWVELHLASGAESHSSPHQRGVTERILVLEGVLDLCLSGIWHQYSAGETVIFSADQPHAYRNSGLGMLVFEDVIHYKEVE